MKLSQSAERAIARTPWLTKALDEYFAPGEFVFDRRNLVAIKWRSDGYYAVLLFEAPPGVLTIVDIAGAQGGQYEVCNDANDCRDEKHWKAVKPDLYCDSYTDGAE